MDRIDRYLLVFLLITLGLMTAMHTFAITQTLRVDAALVEEAVRLRREMDDTQRVINNARDISEASVDFWRCAFLIEPDVEKTPPVVEECIDAAKFPANVKEKM